MKFFEKLGLLSYIAGIVLISTTTFGWGIIIPLLVIFGGAYLFFVGDK